MQNFQKKSAFKQNKFLSVYFLVVLIINLIGLIWAMQPSAVGLYILLLVVFPLNIMSLAVGLFKILRLFLQKAKINFLLHIAVVLMVPLICSVLSYLLVANFADNGGC